MAEPEPWSSSASPASAAANSFRHGLLSVLTLPHRRLRRTMRAFLLILILLIVIVPLGGHYSGLSSGMDTMLKTAAPATDDPESAIKNQERANFQAQFNRTRELAGHPSPLSLLRYCSNPNYKTSNANYLVSAVLDEGTIARMDFGHSSNGPRYNPNILPFPKSYKHPYIGFARQSPQKGLYHHEIVWCEMDWADTPAIGRKTLACVGKETKVDLAEWGTPAGLCKKVSYLALKQGLADPRILFSPWGEPLMIVGTNGQSNCMNQFVIDLRVVVPGLNWKMKLQGVPIRFKQLTELPRPQYNEIEKNWFLMWDEINVGYVQHEIEDRSVSLLFGARSKQVNIASPGIPECISSLKKKLDGVEHLNEIHQATNSLRVTLCDFPCIPTIHNTVIIELMHMKYKNHFEIFYRRYAIIMNATAPFNIIGRTGNLMYAGTDEKSMLYTVSITWDHEHYRAHEDWNEFTHGGQWYLDEINGTEKTVEIDTPKMLQKRATPSPTPDQSSDSVAVSTTESSTQSPTAAAAPSASNQPAAAENEKKELPQNPLVNKYYHGWLNDMMMISIGFNDQDSAILHVPARDLLECMHICT
ncbi:hypothetical protein V1525DRAFT_16897 [Lipomyces kononenkoae]|uniref:Uncharacterized protein n=1 Tax=Lipomyces kononenkoae TaxID=34357 RepID=A0ACC3T859_LIPKO